MLWFVPILLLYLFHEFIKNVTFSKLFFEYKIRICSLEKYIIDYKNSDNQK